MTDSFLHLIFDEGTVPCTFNRDIHYKEEVNTDRARQTKMSLCLAVSLTFFCSVLIQFPARQERASLS